MKASRVFPAVGLVLAVGVISASCGQPSGSGTASAPDSKELRAVKAYLKENLDDPTVEVVRWWPAKTMKKEYDASLKELKDWLAKSEANKDRDAVKDYKGAINKLEAYGPTVVARLKYRTKEGGGLVLRDEAFVIKNGKAERAEDSSQHVRWQNRIDEFFPD